MELAKAAVGSFALMDFDRLERHNVVRHACYLQDVGRLKTDAVADLVLGKNPYARCISDFCHDHLPHQPQHLHFRRLLSCAAGEGATVDTTTDVEDTEAIFDQHGHRLIKQRAGDRAVSAFFFALEWRVLWVR